MWNGVKACGFSILMIFNIESYAGEQQKTPAQYFPILESEYLLQAFDSGNEVSEQAITPNLKNQYFYSNCADLVSCESAIPKGAIIFSVPSGFSSTPNSEYPRSELRATKEFVNGGDFNNEQSGSVYIVSSPSTNSIIFAQIHGANSGGSELFKLRWKNGSVVAGVKEKYGGPEKQTTLLSDVNLKDKIDYTLRAKGTSSSIEVTILISSNGRSNSKSFVFPKESWQGVKLYFKAGNYNQDSKLDGSKSVVAFSKLSVHYE